MDQNRTVKIALMVGEENVSDSGNDFFLALQYNLDSAYPACDADATASHSIKKSVMSGNISPKQCRRPEDQYIQTHEKIS
jgi:hypothetical protein